VFSENDTLYYLSNEPFKLRKAREFLAKDLGLELSIIFILKDISQLEYSKKLKEETEDKNSELWRRIGLKHNSNIKMQFESQLKSEYQKIILAQSLFDNNKKVQNFLNNIYKTGPFVIPIPRKKISDSIYVWYTWKIYNDDDEFKTNEPFAKFNINLSNNEIIIKTSEK